MTDSTLTSLVLLALAAALAPLLVDLGARLVVLPLVVVEIAFGVILGPDLLGWVRDDAVVTLLSNLGLAMLMFFAGYEMDLGRIRGQPGSLALRTWALSLALGFGIGLLLHVSGFPDSGLIVGLALTTTALGTILPILKDNGELESSFGVHVLATGAVGEFGPVLAVSVLLSTRTPSTSALLLVAFAAVAALAAVLAMRPRPGRLSRVLSATLRTSGQLPVRLTLLVLFALIWVAAELGLDVLLGAFTAGLVMRLFVSGADRQEVALIDDKLEAVGFGLLIPIFFIVSGVRFDLSALLGDAVALVMLPVFLCSFLIARGGPVLVLYRAALPPLERRALALFASTSLPLVVAITTIGVQTGRLEADLAAALVGAAMVSVAVFPLVALRIRRTEVTAR